MRGNGLEKLVNKIIGQNIKSIRLGRNMSQSDVASILDMSFQQIQKYENGLNRISASNLFLLAQSLRIPVEDFFIGIAVHFEGEKK